jgi:hypothetical protein
MPPDEAPVPGPELSVPRPEAAGCRSRGWPKVAGIGSTLNWLGGHMTRNARPTTSFSGIVPSRS